MHISTKLLFLAAVLVFQPATGLADQLHVEFTRSEDPKQIALAVSPCTGEETAECLDHIFICDTTNWANLKLDVITGPIESLATKLIVGTEGQVSGRLKLASGKVSVEMPVASIELNPNELDGGWGLTVAFGDSETILDAITAKNAEDAALILADHEFKLAPEKGDGAKVLAFKNACAKLAN